MGLLDNIKSIFGATKKTSIPVARAVADPTKKPAPAGRVSTNSERNSFLRNPVTIVPPVDHADFWQVTRLDITTLKLYRPKQLVDMLIDIHPDISRAIWDFQRMLNPGYECKVFDLDGKSINAAGQAHVDGVFTKLKELYGSADVVIGRFFMGAILRGGFASELVLDENAEQTVDWVAPDPYSIRFREVADGVRGKVWQPGQWQNGEFVPLDIPTFRYVPVDPAPANPYGRSLVTPSLFTAIFLLSLLHDVKRIVMQQGYKRLTIKLDTEMADENYNRDNQGMDSLGEYIAEAIRKVMETYAALQPEDAFVYTDMFEFGVPAGTIDSDSIGAIDRLIERLERQIARALKTNSLLMDINQTTNEADSNRRWEIYSAGVKSLQHFCENMMESQLQVSLQAVGIQAKVQMRFAELRAAEMFRDEQTKAMQIQNARNMYEAGYTSQDESANYATGHNADQTEPRKPLVNLDFQQDNNSGNEDVTKEDRFKLTESIRQEIYRIVKSQDDHHRLVNGNGKTK